MARYIVTALSVPCSFCGAKGGEPCRDVRVGKAVGYAYGPHGARMWDADAAQKACDALEGTT